MWNDSTSPAAVRIVVCFPFFFLATVAQEGTAGGGGGGGSGGGAGSAGLGAAGCLGGGCGVTSNTDDGALDFRMEISTCRARTVSVRAEMASEWVLSNFVKRVPKILGR